MTSTVRTDRAPQSLLRPMWAVLRWGLLAGLVVLVVTVALGYALIGVPGAWGAALGVGLSVLFFTMTVGLAIATARLQPKWLGIAVLASWLAKIILLIVALAALREADFYSRPAFFGSLLLCTFGYLGLEAVIVSRTKVLYVETEFAADQATP